MDSILLTGASGFVGRQILKVLEKHNVEITVINRSGKISTYQNFSKVKRVITTKNLFTESDLWYENVCKNKDIIIHAAWFAEPGMYLDSKLNFECEQGTIKFASAALKNNIKKFVGIGTCFEYDVSYGQLSVITPLAPSSIYAKAKVNTFLNIKKIFENGNHRSTYAWCRLFYLFGENEDERRLVSLLRKKLSKGEHVKLSKGEQIRDFINVRDAAEQIAHIALTDINGPQNICSGIGITVRGMAEKVATDYAGGKELLIFGALKEREFDPPKIIGVKSFI